MRVSVIIPVLNEEHSIASVLRHLPWDLVEEVIVVDNGSTDRTAEVAVSLGAKVVCEKRRGYGHACLKGIAELHDPGIVVFLDGDFSDYPEEMGMLIEPIESNRVDLVIGSRTLGNREDGALPPHAHLGNRLAGVLIRFFFGYRYTDLGPFRAIRFSSLKELRMQDRNFGWTVEMQIKAARQKLRVLEVPVSYRKRIGESKISGTLVGSLKAGTKILWTILKYGFA